MRLTWGSVAKNGGFRGMMAQTPQAFQYARPISTEEKPRPKRGERSRLSIRKRRLLGTGGNQTVLLRYRQANAARIQTLTRPSCRPFPCSAARRSGRQDSREPERGQTPCRSHAARRGCDPIVRPGLQRRTDSRSQALQEQWHFQARDYPAAGPRGAQEGSGAAYGAGDNGAHAGHSRRVRAYAKCHAEPDN